MITIVRIAPVEKWCKFYAPPPGAEQAAANLVGTPVAIETTSVCQAQKCEGRMWNATEESWARIDTIIYGAPRDVTRRGICEHVLEMD